MKGFPQLTKEDIQQLDTLLKDFVTRSGALAALMVESAGYLIHHVGEMPADPAEFSSLAANAFNAAQEMSRRLKENYFTQLRVTGTTYQTLIRQVDESCLLVVVFRADMDGKKVEDDVLPPVIGLYELLKIARHRAPAVTVDLADADAESFTKFFRRTPPPDQPPTS
jgi:predicted regulator of Ras-like GTPase activity (Roadblock/LC7/MglB family)